MRTYLLISALVGLFLTTMGQTVSQPSTAATETSAGSQSSTTETITTTSAPNGSQSSTSETSGTTSAPNGSQSSTSEISTATSVSQSSTSEISTATSVSQSSTIKTSVSVTSVTGSSVSETPESKPTVTGITEGGSNQSTAVKPEITTSTAAPTTTVPVKQFCNATSCGDSFATCIQLFESYICQCPLNYYFDKTNLSCTTGESFYGKLALSSRTFNPLKESKEYTDIYNEVVNYFKGCFENNDDYFDTIITDISANPSKVQTRNTKSGQSVEVRCAHLFQPGKVNAKDVEKKIIDYNGAERPGQYVSSDICDGHYCDILTTNCINKTNSNPVCTCKDGFYPSTSQLTITSCRGCDPKCGNDPGEQCIRSDLTKPPYCGCLPGYEKKSDICEKCQFGYSGAECADNFLLILVIVGSVAGAVVIALLGTVIGLSVRSSRRKHDNEMTQLITKDTMESPMAGNLFPKVQAKTDLGYVNRGSSPYDTTDEYPRPTPKRDYDDDPWYEMGSRERRY